MIPSVVNSPNLTSTQVIRPPKLNALLEETSIIKFAGLFLETDRYKLPKATKLELIKQLSNPAITAKKIESKRQAIEELSKIDTAQLWPGT